MQETIPGLSHVPQEGEQHPGLDLSVETPRSDSRHWQMSPRRSQTLQLKLFQSLEWHWVSVGWLSSPRPLSLGLLCACPQCEWTCWGC